MADTTMVEVGMFEPATAAILQPWLAAQITDQGHLSLVIEALRALWWEWSAAEWGAMAAQALSWASNVENATQVVGRLVQAEGNLLYACTLWEEAGALAPEPAQIQHDRLMALAQRVRTWIIQVCDAWGISVPVQSSGE